MEAKNYCYNNFESVNMQEKKQYFKNFANSLPPHKIIVSKTPDQNLYIFNSHNENIVLENSVIIIDENYNKKKIIFNRSSKNFTVSENVIKLECINNDKIGHEIVLNEEIDKSKVNCLEYASSNGAEEVKVADNKLQFSKIDDIEMFNEFQISETNNVIIASQIYIENNPSQNLNVRKDSHLNSFISAKQKNSDAPKKVENLVSCSKVVSYKQNQSEKESENLLNSDTFAKKINLKKLNCFYCGKHFNKLFNLQQHERIHTGERPFQCIICGRAFSQKSNVIKHMTRHKVWPSPTLTINFKPNKKNHLSKKENLVELMNYSCQYCSLSFKSYSLLKKHLISHSDVKVYRCIQKTCYETFKDIDEFLLHSKKHSTVEFTCHICLKSFTTLGDLGEHQYEHNKNDPKLTDLDKKNNSKRLKCKICCAQFKSIQSYQNHMAVDTHKYECVQCKNVFSSERALRRHLNLHIREQTAFEASILQQERQLGKITFQNKKTLKTHELVHLSENLFNCDQCHKEFSTKFRLQRHLSSHLNFECPYKSILGCDKTFLTKDNLKDHVYSHQQSRKCKICLKTFSSFSKMNQHFEKEHFHKSNKKSPRSKSCPQAIKKKQKQSNQHRCIADNNKIKRTKIRKEKLDKETETVANIEIIMVPCFS